MTLFMRESGEKGKLLVLSGFSGAGKGTVIRCLMEHHPEYVFSVSATTRAPRPGEVDGRDYFFVTQEKFDAAAEEGRFLEHAGYVGKSYGTPAEYVEKMREKGLSVVLDIESQGAFQVREACPDAKLVYLIPPSAELLKSRLIGRGTETAEQICRRLAKAVEEAPLAERYDAIIINDSVLEAAEELHRIVAKDGKPRIPKEEAAQLSRRIGEDLAELLKESESCDTI